MTSAPPPTTTRAEDIAREMVKSLTDPAMASVPAANVYRDLIGALQAGKAESMPAVVIEVGNEEAPDELVIGRVMRAVYIDVHALQAGPDAASAVDAIALEAYNRIVQSAGLKAMVFELSEGAVTRENGVAGSRIALVTRTWRVRYSTAAASIQ